MSFSVVSWALPTMRAPSGPADVHGLADSLRAGVTGDYVGAGEDAELDLGALRSGVLHAFDVRQPTGT
ncbi:hypothetical protein ACWGDX_00335 [Streptomyces sp. NPDC055025]